MLPAVGRVRPGCRTSATARTVRYGRCWRGSRSGSRSCSRWTICSGPTTRRWSSSRTAAPAPARARRARAGVPARAGAAAARDRAGDRGARRRVIEHPLRHAVVRRRAVAARRRRSPARCAGRSSRRAAATRSSCSSSRASTRRAAASPRSPAGAGVPRAVARALEQEIAALSEAGGGWRRARRSRATPWTSTSRSPPPGCEEARGARRARRAAGRRAARRHGHAAALSLPPPARAATRSTTRPPAAGGSPRTAAPRRRCAERGGSLAARAHHLERCARPGDAEAVEVLVEAGRHAAARAPATAADRFAAALRLLPETPETLPRRLELLVGLAQALAATGRLEQRARGARRRPGARRAGARAGARAAGRGLRDVREPARPPRAPRTRGCSARRRSSARRARSRPPTWRSSSPPTRSTTATSPACARGRGAPGRPRGRRRARVRRRRDRAGVLRRARARARSPRRRRCARTPPPGSTRSTTARSRGRLDTAYYLGFAEFFCEHYDDAIRHFRRGIAVSRASGQGQFVIPMTIGLAHALEVRGRLDEAAEHADAAVEGARLWGNDQMLCFALTADAWVRALRGELDRARAPPAPRRWRCSTGSTRACSRAPPACTSPPRSSRPASPRAASPP